MAAALYSTLRWRLARKRALERDRHTCTVSRLLGGQCSPGPLHVHHIVPVEEGGALYDLENLGTVCARHHPKWEALRRTILGEREPDATNRIRCPHRHRSKEAREICERRRARQLARELAA